MAARPVVVKMRHSSSQEERKKDKVNKTEANKENILLEHLKYCLSVSSFHGMNHIVWPNRSLIERLFWIGCVIGVTVFGILKGYEVYTHYQYRPSIVGIEMDYWNWVNEFPSVTICQQELDENYLRSKNISKDSEMYGYLKDLAFGNYTSYHLYEKYANGSKKEYLQPEQYLEVLLEAAYSTDRNLFLENQYPADEKRPIPIIITEIGICTTLNPSSGIYYTPEYFNSSAPYKYEPINFDYKRKYVKLDLRNTIHRSKLSLLSNEEQVAITTETIDLLNSTLTGLTIDLVAVVTQESVESLNYKQRDCKLPHETEGLDHSPVYTHTLCEMECRIKLCLKYCNCTPYYYRRLEGEKICNMTGMYCLSKYTKQLVELRDDDEENICFCYQNCNSLIVSIQQRQSDTWLSGIRLVVETEKHPSLRYVRKLIFTRLDLIVQIGGILGLCLGCSILSIIEVVYFMTLRFYWGVFTGRSIKSSL